jgi:tetratricopeptide (TPR) repeat protein
MMEPLSQHPSRDFLDQFARGQLSGAAQKRVLRHLFEGCEECRSRLAGKWETRPEAVGETAESDGYDEVFDRVVESVVAQEPSIAEERAAGHQLFDELMRHPTAHQLLLVHNSPRFRNRFLCERLLEASHEAGFREPDRAIELAGIAVEVSGALAVDACGTADLLRGLRARAWAQYGNALRISSDHAGADRAFHEAERILKSGWTPPLDRARILDLQASLRRDQRRFAEAAHALDRVIAVYQELGQWNMLGRALKQKSMICGEAGDTESEIALLRRALDLLDPQEEPRTFLAARHNLILALNDTGRSREAFVLLFHTRPLYLKLGDRMNLLRLRWVEGSVALGLGRTEQAATAFKEVRDAFIELGVDYDAALVSLDLAAAYILQGRTAEVRDLAAEMMAVFQARNINREALAALLFFRRTAEVEQAGLDVVRRVSEFLKKVRNDPALQFEVPS